MTSTPHEDLTDLIDQYRHRISLPVAIGRTATDAAALYLLLDALADAIRPDAPALTQAGLVIVVDRALTAAATRGNNQGAKICTHCGNTTGRLLTTIDAGGRLNAVCAGICKPADTEHSAASTTATGEITGGTERDGARP